MSDVEARDIDIEEAVEGAAVDAEGADLTSDLSDAAGIVDGDADADGDGEEERPNRRGKVAAIAAGLALLAVLGGGAAWASGSLPGGSETGAQKPAAEQVESGDKKEAGLGVSITAEGWTEEVGPFGFAAVNEEGAVAHEGEVKPGEDVSLKLDDGVYALSITSIPTAADGKSTWSVPASQMVMVEDGKASPSKVSFTLLPVDPTDAAAVEAVTANLPEAEREAARAHLSAKRDDPSSNKVNSTPVKPQPAPPAGSVGPSKQWGIVQKAWDERVLVTPARDEVVVLKDAWTETVLDTPEKVDYIEHPATYKTIKEKVGVQFVAKDGTVFSSEDECVYYCNKTGQVYSVLPIYEEKQVLDKEAWTETVITPATYKEVYHPAVTETKHHEAVYKTVHHEAVWGWI